MYALVATQPSTNTVEPCLTAKVLPIESKRFRTLLWKDRLLFWISLEQMNSHHVSKCSWSLESPRETTLVFSCWKYTRQDTNRSVTTLQRETNCERQSLLFPWGKIHITRMREYGMPTWMKILNIFQWYILCSYQDWYVSKVGNLAYNYVRINKVKNFISIQWPN